jgi:hypothetical protein
MNTRQHAPRGLTGTLIVGALFIGFFNSTNILAQTKDTLMDRQHQIVEWELGRLNDSPINGKTISGKPEKVSCPYGKAMQFDGLGDGIFLDENPLENLAQFTIEVVIYPDPKGEFEQRFLHMGEVNGDRVLLELRLTKEDQWYLDAYIKAAGAFQTLIDSSLAHPAGAWYRVAFVVDNGKTATYVNGKHELDGKIIFSPFKSGKTSIGVRLNKKSWFKGAIYKVRITPRCLAPSEFIKP